MRKHSITIAAALACIALLAQCKKDKSNNDYSFSSSTAQDSIALTLIVNGENKGQLPYVSQGLDDCSDTRGLRFSLPLGQHHIVALSASGDTISEVHPLLESDDATGNGTKGSSTMIAVNRCVTLELGY